MERVQEISLKLNVNCAGWIGKWVGGNTKIEMSCPLDGHKWQPTIWNFLKSKGCQKCSDKANGILRRKGDDHAINSFLSTGKFLQGTRFWKSPRKDSQGKGVYWKYECPVCSSDAYVQNGICTGVFESTSYNLQAGKLSCRCAVNYLWSQEQREYQIAKLLHHEDNYSFVGWVDGYRKTHDKATIKCVEHGTWDVSLVSFLYAGSRCPGCARTGFDPTKPAHLYVLKVTGQLTDFVGYGISNSVKERLATHYRNLAISGFTPTSLNKFYTSGKIALEIEGKIKYNFPQCPQTVEGFKTEATTTDEFDNLLEFITTHLDRAKHEDYRTSVS